MLYSFITSKQIKVLYVIKVIDHMHSEGFKRMLGCCFTVKFIVMQMTLMLSHGHNNINRFTV